MLEKPACLLVVLAIPSQSPPPLLRTILHVAQQELPGRGRHCVRAGEIISSLVVLLRQYSAARASSGPASSPDPMASWKLGVVPVACGLCDPCGTRGPVRGEPQCLDILRLAHPSGTYPFCATME